MAEYDGTPKIPAKLDLPDTNVPFNPSTVNPPIRGNRDATKALEQYGVFGYKFNLAKFPYPPDDLSLTPYINADTYYFGGSIILLAATPILISPARSYTRVITEQPERDPASWWAAAENESTTPRKAWKQKYSPLTADNPWLTWFVRVPSGITLTSVKMRIDPPGGHGENLPATQPLFRLWRYTATNGLMTPIGTTYQDTQTDATAYEAAHDLQVTGLSYSSFGAEDALVIGFRGEEGTNALAASPNYTDGGLVVYAPVITFTRGKIDTE